MNETLDSILCDELMARDSSMFVCCRECELEVLNEDGKTPLRIAAKYGAVNVVKLLLKAGARRPTETIYDAIDAKKNAVHVVQVGKIYF